MLQGNSIHLNVLSLFKLLERASGLLQLQHRKHDVILLIQSGVVTDMRLNNKILSRDIAISFLIPWMTRPEVYFSFIALPHLTEVRSGIKLSGVPLLLELLHDRPEEGIFERLALETSPAQITQHITQQITQKITQQVVQSDSQTVRWVS